MGKVWEKKIEEKPDKEVQMEVMVAVGEGMENGDVRGIKNGDQGGGWGDMDNCYEDMMDEVLEESMGEGVDDMDKEAAPDLGDGRPSVIYFKQAEKKTMLPLLSWMLYAECFDDTQDVKQQIKAILDKCNKCDH